MIRLSLICHAATSATRRAAFADRDEPIDPEGRAQAGILAGALPRSERCILAPALSATQTAQAFGLTGPVDFALRDLDCGRWAGRAFDDVAAREPEAVAAWTTDPAAAPHGGESVLHLIGRVAAWLDGPGPGQGRTLVVTHPAVVRAVIVHSLGADPRGFWRIDAGPLSRAELSGRPGRWTLRALIPYAPRSKSC